jgi:SAM-dependent methyltransferase
MDSHLDYLMENDDEIRRLEIKTDISAVHRQARWAGLKKGMRVADIGCGPGKTSRAIADLLGPTGEVVGVEISPHRVAYAREKYADGRVRFVHRNAIEPLDDLGLFDFIWVRFLLEYHRDKAFQIRKEFIPNPSSGRCSLPHRPGHNCLNHFGIPERLSKALHQIMGLLEERANFDPFVGIKLYSFSMIWAMTPSMPR